MKAALRVVSSGLLVAAVSLMAWGGYGIATFPEADGSGYDPRFVVFDNGYYPAFWGALLLLFGAGLRFLSRDRRRSS